MFPEKLVQSIDFVNKMKYNLKFDTFERVKSVKLEILS